MKSILTFLILIFSTIVFSQSETVAGDYALTLDTNDNNVFEYKLTLSPDGSFFFHYYSRIKQGSPTEVHKYGKGTWTAENNVVSFFSDKAKDLDGKHSLDFADSNARFIIKSPRDKTDKIVKTRLQFLKSEIFWMERIALFKV